MLGYSIVGSSCLPSSAEVCWWANCSGDSSSDELTAAVGEVGVRELVIHDKFIQLVSFLTTKDTPFAIKGIRCVICVRTESGH